MTCPAVADHSESLYSCFNGKKLKYFRGNHQIVSYEDCEDPAIDVDALLKDVDFLRETLVRVAPELATNHHNYVRVSAIEQLVGKAMSYVNTMK